MSRFRSRPEMVISRANAGTIGAEWKARDKALALFDLRERNDILRESCRQGGIHWLNVFWPKRFTEYARRLGYAITIKYWKRKRKLMGADNPPPLIFTGQMADTAGAGARVQAVATSKKQQIIITLPTGHPIAPVVSRVIKTVPDWEIKSIALVVGNTLESYIKNADKSDTQRSRLTVPQRARLDAIKRITAGSRRTTKRGAA